MLTKLNFFKFLLAISFFVGACSQPEAPSGQPIDFSGGQPQLSGGDLVFDVPEGWIEEAPASAMRRAQYRLPGEGGADAELAIFAGIGGSVEQNVNRWIDQFSTADGKSVRDSATVTHRQLDGMETTLVDVLGTFKASSMGPMGGSGEDKPDYRMLGAVIEAPSGPWFLKLTGPQETVTKWEASFESYLESVRAGGGS
jgi:hypothetical protein